MTVQRSIKATTRTATRTAKPTYVDDPEDAASKAAGQLTVVMWLIRAYENRTPGNDDGGYGLITAYELVHQIRDDLRKSVAQAQEERVRFGGVR